MFNCCGCDAKSFVQHSPIAITGVLPHVDQSSSKCCHLGENKKIKRYDLCKNGNNRGRWISLESYCNGNMNNTAPTHDSGDICSIKSQKIEENGSQHYIFEPYSCRYHIYTGDLIHKCFNGLGIKHLHLHGDSLARNLFTKLIFTLGGKKVDDENLKEKMNANEKLHELHETANGTHISIGYTWDWVEDPAKNRLHLANTGNPPPDIVSTNYALAHNIRDIFIAKESFENGELQFWKNNSHFKHRIYQSAPVRAGRRAIHWSQSYEQFRRINQMVKVSLVSLSPEPFLVLDEFVLSEGRRHPNISVDGWHYNGTTLQMVAQVYLNILCNDWLRKQE